MIVILDANKIMQSLTVDDIIKILTELGSNPPKNGGNNSLIFQTVCHKISNGSYKLYYYIDSHYFHCYTDCNENFNIYHLIMKNKLLQGIDMGFYEAVEFVAYVTGRYIHNTNKETNKTDLINDWDFINNYNVKRTEPIKLPTINLNILNYFSEHYHKSWIDEGIGIKTMKKFNIKFYDYQNKIIIPHYDIKGNLIGIRGRALNQEEIDMGKKYMPIYINDNVFRNEKNEIVGFNHNTSLNFYGIHKTKEAIKRFRKVAVFEAEKSVYKCEEFYQEDNFSVSMGGSGKFSKQQIDMLLDLGVEEVILCYDKEYHQDETEESEKYAMKICKTVINLLPYFRVYILWDTNNLIGYKDAPCDRGQNILEILMKNKIEIDIDTIHDMLGSGVN